MTDIRSFDRGVGSPFHHSSRVRKPPFDPGRSDFRSPVLAVAQPHWPSHARRGLHAGAHIPPALARFANTLVLTQAILVITHVWPDRHHVPRGPLPAEGVTLGRVQFTHTSEGVTPLSSLLRPHAPLLRPLFSSRCSTCENSPCGLSPPSWPQDFPVVISAHLSLRAWTPTPAALAVHVPVTSRKTTAFPP